MDHTVVIVVVVWKRSSMDVPPAPNTNKLNSLNSPFLGSAMDACGRRSYNSPHGTTMFLSLVTAFFATCLLPIKTSWE
jgi:ABC-type phosphate/phosphonate transport system permease subunit